MDVDQKHHCVGIYDLAFKAHPANMPLSAAHQGPGALTKNQHLGSDKTSIADCDKSRLTAETNGCHS